MKTFILMLAVTLVLVSAAHPQLPTAAIVKIVKAEDARRYDTVLEDLMRSPDEATRKRAALAAGRIGDDQAIEALAGLLANDASLDVRAMAAFAIGEIESIKGSDAILKVLGDNRSPSPVRARAVEAAGKIAAANVKDDRAKSLGSAIVEVLKFEHGKRSAPYLDVVRLALTAALRARPEGAAEVVKNFLGYSDPQVVADALNTLTRLRAKNANPESRELLKNSAPIVRANAARVLGAAEDKDSLDLLFTAATTDADARVRVSAIRALGSLKDAKIADKLLERGERLFNDLKRSKFANPVEKNELLEITSTLGRLLTGTNSAQAVKFLDDLRYSVNYESPEIEIAFARISPAAYFKAVPRKRNPNETFWKQANATFEGMAELAKLADKGRSLDNDGPPEKYFARLLSSENAGKLSGNTQRAVPALLRTYAEFKPADLSEVLKQQLNKPDLFVRAAAAELLAEQPNTKENVEALKKAFDMAFIRDKDYNDAQLATMDALYKLDKKESVGSLLVALNATDYLVRKKAFELLADKDLQKDFPGIPTSLEIARSKHKHQVLPYTSAFGTKLGQLLNTDADYLRAASRKNGSVAAVLTTEKGTFTITLTPEDAPLTVDNFIKLARSGYFNGLEVHRVVPNFVMQDGDPRGDGNGGPGWSIRCEVNMLPYDRGAVGMALSGKDTGGSQWFVTHSPQPHLDGGYTVFGHVNETDMKVVDNIVRGDKILKVMIVEK